MRRSGTGLTCGNSTKTFQKKVAMNLAGISFTAFGIGLMVTSAFVVNDLLSGVLGIIAITSIWDGIELYRQKKRVERAA
jgi:hypothetical protein